MQFSMDAVFNTLMTFRTLLLSWTADVRKTAPAINGCVESLKLV
jgi:hypothetical protein